MPRSTGRAAPGRLLNITRCLERHSMPRVPPHPLHVPASCLADGCTRLRKASHHGKRGCGFAGPAGKQGSECRAGNSGFVPAAASRASSSTTGLGTTWYLLAVLAGFESAQCSVCVTASCDTPFSRPCIPC